MTVMSWRRSRSEITSCEKQVQHSDRQKKKNKYHHTSIFRGTRNRADKDNTDMHVYMSKSTCRCMYVCMYVHIYIYRSIYLSIYLSIGIYVIDTAAFTRRHLYVCLYARRTIIIVVVLTLNGMSGESKYNTADKRSRIRRKHGPKSQSMRTHQTAALRALNPNPSNPLRKLSGKTTEKNRSHTTDVLSPEP